MSARRFCAAVDELCDNVPSSAPNSRWPRLRSSAASSPPRLPAFRSAAGADVEVEVEVEVSGAGGDRVVSCGDDATRSS